MVTPAVADTEEAAAVMEEGLVVMEVLLPVAAIACRTSVLDSRSKTGI
jgi:hypothetical protein